MHLIHLSPKIHLIHLIYLLHLICQGLQASAQDGADGVLRDEDEGDRAEGNLHRHRHPAAQGGVQAGGEGGLQVRKKRDFSDINYERNYSDLNLNQRAKS